MPSSSSSSTIKSDLRPRAAVPSSLATTAIAYVVVVLFLHSATTSCDSFGITAPPSIRRPPAHRRRHHRHRHHYHPRIRSPIRTPKRRQDDDDSAATPRRNLFRELILEDEEDLRANIAVVEKSNGLDDFLDEDDRPCVIKLHAPYCKACRAFGIKFRKLAMRRGDLVNTAGEAVRAGEARFGAIDYASNVKLCRELGVGKFPTVLVFRGGGGGGGGRRCCGDDDDNDGDDAGGGDEGDGGNDHDRRRRERPCEEIACKASAIEDMVAEIDRLTSSSPSER